MLLSLFVVNIINFVFSSSYDIYEGADNINIDKLKNNNIILSEVNNDYNAKSTIIYDLFSIIEDENNFPKSKGVHDYGFIRIYLLIIKYFVDAPSNLNAIATNQKYILYLIYSKVLKNIENCYNENENQKIHDYSHKDIYHENLVRFSHFCDLMSIIILLKDMNTVSFDSTSKNINLFNRIMFKYFNNSIKSTHLVVLQDIIDEFIVGPANQLTETSYIKIFQGIVDAYISILDFSNEIEEAELTGNRKY